MSVYMWWDCTETLSHVIDGELFPKWRRQHDRGRLTCSAAAKTTCACGRGCKAVKGVLVREGGKVTTEVRIRARKIFVRGAGDVAKTTCVCGRGGNVAEEAFVRGGGNMVREAAIRAGKIFVRGVGGMAK